MTKSELMNVFRLNLYNILIYHGIHMYYLFFMIITIWRSMSQPEIIKRSVGHSA